MIRETKEKVKKLPAPFRTLKKEGSNLLLLDQFFF